MKHATNQFLLFGILAVMSISVSCDLDLRPKVAAIDPDEDISGLSVTFRGMIEIDHKSRSEVGFVWSDINKFPTLDDFSVATSRDDIDGVSFSSIVNDHPSFSEGTDMYWMRAYVKYDDNVSYSDGSVGFSFGNLNVSLGNIDRVNDTIFTTGFISIASSTQEMTYGHLIALRADAEIDDSDLVAIKSTTAQMQDLQFDNEFSVPFNQRYYIRAYVQTPTDITYSNVDSLSVGGGWLRLKDLGINEEFPFGIGEGFQNAGLVGLGWHAGGRYDLFKIVPDSEEGYIKESTGTDGYVWDELAQNKSSDGMSFAIDEVLYFGFGETRTAPKKLGESLYKFDLTTNTWDDAPNGGFLPGEAKARKKGFGVALNGMGYVGCGIADDDMILADIYRYDPVMGYTDSIPSPYPEDLADAGAWGMSAVAMGDEFYLIGGFTTAASRRFYSYNESTNWSALPDFKGSPRYDAVAFAIDGKIYFGTGTGGNLDILYSDFWVYDPATGWEVLPESQPFPGRSRFGAVAFVVNGKAYVASGLNDDAAELDDIYVYEPTR